MSTKRLAIRGVAFNWLGRVCALAITFVLTPIMVHGLGNEAYGIWAIVMSFTSYYALADLGLGSAGVKYLSQFEAVGDRQSANKVITTSLAVYTFLAIALMLAVALVAMVLPFFLDSGRVGDTTLRWVIVLSGLTIALGFFGRAFDSALVAAKRFDLTNAISLATLVLQAVLLVTIVKSGGSLLQMALAMVSVAALTQITTYILASRVVGNASLSPRFFEWAIGKRLFRFGSLTLVHGLAKRVTLSAGTIIIGIIHGPALAAFYSVAESLVNKSLEVCVGINAVLMPVASQLEAQKRHDALVHVLLLATRVFVCLGLTFTVVFIALGSPLVGLWISQEYATASYPALCFLAISMAIHQSTMGARHILRGTDNVGFLAKASMIDVVLSLSLGGVLASTNGLTGMACAMLISQVVTAGILIPQFTCRTMNLPWSRFVQSGVLRGIAAACPGLAVGFAMTLLTPPTYIVQVIVQILFVFLTSAVSILFICFDRRLRNDILQSFLPTRFSTTKAEDSKLAECGSERV